MKLAYALLVLGAAFAATACGSYEGSPPPTATLRVAQVLDESGGLYAEGSRSYVRLVAPNDAVRAEEELDPETQSIVLTVPAGPYTLESWQRPCDGNCGYLDPPTDRCSATLEVDAGTATRATVRLRPGEGCTIEVA
ncbi:MAG TPA: hypothetical protein VFW80_07420 [Gaiellaceae bacterium]|nr:hypothetical protein [Gaiellaceae bacterium]